MSTITEVQPMETLQMRLPSTLKPSTTGSANVSRRNKIKLDPLRALEPARKKLSTIEAQRIMAVIEDSIRRCDIVAVLPHVINNLDKYTTLLGPQLSQLLAEHKKIYDKYSSLELKHTDISLQISQAETSQADIPEDQEAGAVATPPASRPTSRHLSSRGSSRYRKQSIKVAPGELSDQMYEILAQIKTAEVQLQLSTKNLMRQFCMNPGMINVLVQEVGNGKSREGHYMVTQLNELKDILMEKLLVSPKEEKEKMHYLSQVNDYKCIIQVYHLHAPFCTCIMYM